ncbi:MAG TPA: Rieske 2Fe-2S domain-containing protein [Actinomycetota bacterium]|nr:Rieske 2Fe-2S domain-containing protein [Actinomycetota bacterium]
MTAVAALVAALSEGNIAFMVAIIVFLLFLTLLTVSLLRTRRGTSGTEFWEGTEHSKEKATAAKAAPLSRRDFFRRALVTSLAVFGAQFGGASIAFLWPNLKGGFGSTINAGSITDIQQQIQQTQQPFYLGSGRFYVVPYNGTGKDEATGVDYYAEGYLIQGVPLMALYQRCVHLGCRVPYCISSQWFECPCHGSKYNKAGEYQLGPAPTGLQRFPITKDASNNLLVDTSTLNPGPPRGTDTIHEPPQGAFCV